MNKSIWEVTATPSRPLGQITTDLESDVVVIGAGISGLTAALLLAEAGKKVIVLEALKTGMGTTGNSTGNLYATVDGHLSDLARKWNLETARQVVTSRLSAIAKIESLINKFGISCDFERTGFHLYTENGNKELDGFLEKEFDVMQQCGLKPEASKNMLPFKTRKTLSIPNQAQFHPLNYVRGISQNLPPGCSLFEDSPVIEYDEEAGIVKTARHTIRAEHIIMATHVPKGIFAVHTVLGPYREYGVAGLLRSGSMPKGIYWGLGKAKHSIRVFNDGPRQYVLAIGDKFKTGNPENTFEYIDKLQAYLRERFDITEFKYVWGGQQYSPADGLPYIGKHHGKLWYMTGFSTDGLVYGTLGAMIISDLILGRTNTWAELYKADRHTPLKSAKEFLKENVDNTLHYLKDIPWLVDAKKVEDIKPGEGKILQEDGEKLAVYRNLEGNLEAVSAVCTHMKCILNWNTSEKSWDCPCHGSRFKTDGEIIEGPAILPLQKKQIKQ